MLENHGNEPDSLVKANQKIKSLEEDNQILRMHVDLLEKDHQILTELYSKINRQKTQLMIENDKLKKQLSDKITKDAKGILIDRKKNDEPKNEQKSVVSRSEKQNKNKIQVHDQFSMLLERNSKQKEENNLLETKPDSNKEVKMEKQKTIEGQLLDKSIEDIEKRLLRKKEERMSSEKRQVQPRVERQSYGKLLEITLNKNWQEQLLPRASSAAIRNTLNFNKQEKAMEKIIKDFSIQEKYLQPRQKSPMIRKNNSQSQLYTRQRSSYEDNPSKRFDYTNWRKTAVSNSGLNCKGVGVNGGKYISLHR